MVGHGGSSAGSYLTDPTSRIPSHCASIVVTSTVRVKMNDVSFDIPESPAHPTMEVPLVHSQIFMICIHIPCLTFIFDNNRADSCHSEVSRTIHLVMRTHGKV